MFVALLGLICLGLALSTIVVPMTLTVDQYKWVWFGGLLAGTLLMSTLFIVFLRHADRSFR
jgi:hypothetical protein